MNRFIAMVRNSITVKLGLLLFGISLIPLVAFSTFAAREFKRDLSSLISRELESSGQAVAAKTLESFTSMTRDLTFLANLWSVKSSYEMLSFYVDSADPAMLDRLRDSEEYKRIIADLAPVFDSWLQLHKGDLAYKDFLIVAGNKGLIAYTMKGFDDSGKFVTDPSFRSGNLLKLWERVTGTGQPAVVDLGVYPPTNEPSLFVGVPVISENKLRGMLAVRLGHEFMDSVFKNSAGFGKTAEAFAVGSDFLVRAGSRMDKDSILRRKADIPAVRSALAGERSTGSYTDEKGVQVLSSWNPIDLSRIDGISADFGWAAVTTINVDEVFAPVHVMQQRIVFFVFVLVVAVVGIAVVASRATSRPVKDLSAVADAMSRGDLTVEAGETSRSDEIGVLWTSFNRMAEFLRAQTKETIEVSGFLLDYSKQMVEVIDSLNEGVTRVTTSVAETGATMQQVKQAAESSIVQARRLESSASKAAEISSQGIRSTDETVEKMASAKTQVTSIEETARQLKEISQSIAEIIGSVKDIADQSNLLAVNASIEAAKAGDQGKTFSVVAAEMKSLSDQSKAAVSRIEVILAEAKDRIDSLAPVVERGAEAVSEGAEQASMAGEVIKTLSSSVVEASQFASVIRSTSEQQSLGIGNVAEAMQGITEAAEKNSLVVSQLRDVSQEFRQVGRRMKELMSRMKI